MEIFAKIVKSLTLLEKCPYLEFSWSLYSRIRAEYGDLRSKSPYSVRMQEYTDQKNSEYGHFLRPISQLIIFAETIMSKYNNYLIVGNLFCSEYQVIFQCSYFCVAYWVIFEEATSSNWICDGSRVIIAMVNVGMTSKLLLTFHRNIRKNSCSGIDNINVVILKAYQKSSEKFIQNELLV